MRGRRRTIEDFHKGREEAGFESLKKEEAGDHGKAGKKETYHDPGRETPEPHEAAAEEAAESKAEEKAEQLPKHAEKKVRPSSSAHAGGGAISRLMRQGR
jgi:hypothetical protein